METFAKGALLATAAAGLVGCASTQSADKTGDHDAMMSGVMCSGVNGCGGQGSCASPDNGYKGQNGCKGKGWISVASADACTAQGGTVVQPKM